MDKLLRSQANIVELPIGVAASSVTVTITDSSGTALVTNGATTNPSLGVYQYALTPAQSVVLDQFKATWSATINGLVNSFETYYEIVGGVYFSIAEARSLKVGSGTPLSDATKYPTDMLVEARQEIEEDIERLVGQALVLRGRRVVLDGNGRAEIQLPDLAVQQSIYSVSIDDSAFDVDDLSDLSISDEGYVTRKSRGIFARGRKNVVIHYVHGEPEVSSTAKRLALILLKHRVIPSDISDRALIRTDESGSLQFTVADSARRRPFGIPEADALIDRLSHHRSYV
jgi:hypothetical protein